MIDTFWLLALVPRFDPKRWARRRLEHGGMALPLGEPIGEVVVATAEAIMRDGPMSGCRLGDLVAADPTTLIGRRGLDATGGRPLVPLLVRFIDAAAGRSIHVHPDDLARSHR